MNEEDLLNFNYPIRPLSHIQVEKTIKERLRSTSMNMHIPREIKRYSDKYVPVTSKHDIEKTINPEILSPELQRSYGMHFGVEGNTVINDIDENENEPDEGQSDDGGSLEGEDDYHYNYYEEDELVNEHDKAEDVI